MVSRDAGTPVPRESRGALRSRLGGNTGNCRLLLLPLLVARCLAGTHTHNSKLVSTELPDLLSDDVEEPTREQSESTLGLAAMQRGPQANGLTQWLLGTQYFDHMLSAPFHRFL